MKAALTAAVLAVAIAIAGCGSSSDNASNPTSAATTAAPSNSGSAAAAIAKRGKPKVTCPKGAPPKNLVVKDLVKGTGPVAKTGDQVSVQYVGVDYKTCKEFDASWDRNQAFPFQLGAGMVIPGWDKGIVGMKVGGRRELIIPPNLAYGSQGQPPVIKPNSTLIFVVDLESVG